MVPRKILPSRRRLKQLFDYDPDSEVFSYKSKLPRSEFASHALWVRYHKLYAGKAISGSPSENHIRVSVNHTRFPVHRIIWKIVTGREPPANLDHINHDGRDNRLSNLRRCTTSQNGGNRLANGGQTTKGVYFSLGKWTARIQVRGHRLHLGRFTTKEAAYTAYCEAGRKHFGPFFHPG